MDIRKSKTAVIYLLMITILSWFLPLYIHAAFRGISVIRDLSHQSGRLGAYRALIIGINDYQDPNIPDLETPVNDAQAMAKLLRDRYGFQIELLLDRKATKEAIFRALRKLASSAKPDDSVLIYFAGHGDLDRFTNDGWWIPADAKSQDPLTYLDNFLVQKYANSTQALHVLIISDSCYSGTLFGQVRAMPPIINDKYYLNLYNEKSRWGMTSGNKTPVSDRGSGGHSVFAYQLLKELKQNEKPYISTQEIYTRIAPIISNNSDQTPICRPIRDTGDQGGEFIFVATIKNIKIHVDKSSASPPHDQKGAPDKNLLFWQRIKESDDIDLYREYLNKFPNGTFITIANRKIETLKERATSFIMGQWVDHETPRYSLVIKKINKKITVTINKTTNPYTYRMKPLNNKFGGYKIEYDKLKHTAQLGRNVKWDGKRLEFIDSGKEYDVYYKLTLIDKDTLKGTKQAKGSAYIANMNFKKLQ